MFSTRYMMSSYKIHYVNKMSKNDLSCCNYIYINQNLVVDNSKYTPIGYGVNYLALEGRGGAWSDQAGRVWDGRYPHPLSSL